MKALKLTFYLLIFLLTFGVVNSIGVFTANGDYVIFTNNTEPTININLTNPSGPIDVVKAVAIINSGEKQGEKNISERILPDSTAVISYSFTLEDFDGLNLNELENGDLLNFFLIAIDADNKQIEIEENSEPTSFDINVDTEKPRITSLSPLIDNGINKRIKIRETTQLISIRFNEKIKTLKLFNEGEEIGSMPQITLPTFNAYPDEYELSLPNNLNLQDNSTKITIGFQDLAGNWNYENYTLVIVGEELEITLLTRKDDGNLSYFYNSSLPKLFGPTIYSSESSYNLKLETSDPSRCYYLDNLFSFTTLNAIDNDSLLNSQSLDNILHSIPIKTANKKIWVACHKIIDPEDIVYLSETLFGLRELVNVSHYTGKLKMQDIIPSTLRTNKIFDISLTTTENARCGYGLNTAPDKFLNTSNLRKHNMFNEELFVDGNHTLNLICVDVLGDIFEESKTFELNTALGVKILSYEPTYTTTSTTTIKYRTTTDADCRVAPAGEIITPTSGSFFSLIESTPTSIDEEYTTTVNSLKEGENIITFSCSNGVQLFNEEKIKITYDPNGPILSNLQFENNGKKSDYLASFEELEYTVDVNSILKVNKFFIEISTPNGTIKTEKSSQKGRIKGDFTGATKIKIIGQNSKGINSSPIEKIIKFDLNPPRISFSRQGKNIVINCFDNENSCEDIEYGFSSTAFTCNPVLDYDGESIVTSDNNYICAHAKDLVGHLTREQLQLIEGFDNGEFDEEKLEDIFDFDEENSDEINESNNEIDEDINEQDEYINDVPFNPQDFNNDTSNATTYSIIAALVTLLGSLGGGGYYAYKKGYLNKHLDKFGFGKKTNPKPSEMPSSSKVSQEDIKDTKDSDKSKNKGSYEDHYKKLNSFLDKTLEGKSGVFKDFDKTNKGKVKGYEDTLIKNKQGSKISKEEFDEFYSSSEDSKVKNSKSLEREAEDFEDYHKNKKQSNKKKD